MKKLNLITKEVEKDPDVIDIYEEAIDMDFFEDFNRSKFQGTTNGQMAIRSNEEFANKAIRLSDEFDYVLGFDRAGEKILVPLKQK